MTQNEIRAKLKNFNFVLSSKLEEGQKLTLKKGGFVDFVVQTTKSGLKYPAVEFDDRQIVSVASLCSYGSGINLDGLITLLVKNASKAITITVVSCKKLDDGYFHYTFSLE